MANDKRSLTIMDQVNHQIESDGYIDSPNTTVVLKNVNIDDLISVLVELRKSGYDIEVSAEIKVALAQ